MAKINLVPVSFHTEKLQIGNLRKTLTEAKDDSSLVFRDKFFPDGIKLKDFSSNEYIIFRSEMIAVTGNLQTEILGLSAQVDAIVIPTNVDVISGYLQSQITDNRNEVIAISGYLQSEIDSIDVPTNIEGLSAYLDNKKMDKIIGGVSGHLIELSGNGNAADSGIVANDVVISRMVDITANGVDGWKVLDRTLCNSGNTIEWQLFAYNADDPEMKYASRITALYSCINIDWTEYAMLNVGGQQNVPVQVVYDSPYIELQVQGTSVLDIKARRISTVL